MDTVQFSHTGITIAASVTLIFTLALIGYEVIARKGFKTHR